MIYHLGMICATFRFDPVGSQTQVPGVTDLLANHYTVRIGKEEAPNFLFASHQNQCQHGGTGDISKPKIKIKFLHICTFGLPRFIIMISHVDIDFGIRQM